ncbi:MAG TPA: flagellar hook-basal body complex protein FliE [Actinomycetota bacterium]|jgi:flagellar hook-basal body complex protein FliE
MAIAPISGFSGFKLGGVTPPAPPAPSAVGALGTSGISSASDSSGGFAGLVKRGLEQVSQAELKADSLLNTMASGGNVAPHEVMIATSQASLAVEMTVAVRDKAVEAYREIMNMQL